MVNIAVRIDIHIYLPKEESLSPEYRIEPVEVSDPTYRESLPGQPSPKLLSQKTGIIPKRSRKPNRALKLQKRNREYYRKLREKVRDDLYELTGVDVNLLATQKVTRRPQLNIYAMDCAKCGKTWADGVGLARHHRIPCKLGRALGLSGHRLGVPENLQVLCVDCHVKADQAVREMIKEKYPEINCYATSPSPNWPKPGLVVTRERRGD